jgi:2-polyprenyl-6-hydroxyphenyl methylase/3-demethylubiquinone-9 3-methyltransferase
MKDTDDRFSFGRNWALFVQNKFDRNRVEAAKISLKSFLGLETLTGKTFLDIGCGSGLFSLAAHELGADRVVSFDYDPESVICCQALRKLAREPETWNIFQGSVLDEAFLHHLGQFNIVYSWGVLHHTGAMWKAIENAASCAGHHGIFFFAIYNRYRANLLRRSETWWQIKRLYNRLPFVGKQVMEWAFIALWFVLELLKGRKPWREIRNYESDMRGMDWRRDVSDWVGGWPYEYASPREIEEYMVHLGWELQYMKPTDGWGCNEYVYKNMSF